MNTTKPTYPPFAKLITTLLIAFLPWCAFSQNNNPSLSLGGDISLEMVVVPAGTFSMGCTFKQAGSCAYDEKPEHQTRE